MKLTKSQLKKIIAEELNKFLEESRRPSEGPNRFLSRSSRNMAMSRGDVDIPDDMRPKTSKKTAKSKLPADHKRIGPAGMGLKFEEESANESKNVIAAFQQLLAEEDVQAEILKVLEDKLKDVDLASLFSSENSDLSALTEKRRK